MTVNTILLCLCGLALLYAAAHDVAARTIPNTVSLLVGVGGAAQAVRHAHPLAAVSVAGAILLAGLVAWRTSLVGGGDVKLLTVTSLWVDPARVPSMLLNMSIAGGALALLYLALDRLPLAAWPDKPQHLVARIARVERRRIRRRSLPYGVAIAAASLVCLARG